MKHRSGKTTPTRLLTVIAGILIIVILFSIASGDPVKYTDVPTENMIDLLNISMSYVGKNHPETKEYMNSDTSWRIADQILESDKHETWYEENGWIGIIKYPSSMQEPFTVQLMYDEDISWEGSLNNSMVEEIGYNFTLSEKERDIKDRVMQFIVDRHPEVSEHVGDPEEMAWERTGSKILEGYSEFTYSCDGWKMTVGSAITAPEYKTLEIVIENPQEDIKWVGVIKDKTINEKSYQKPS